MSVESNDHPDIIAFPPAIAGGVVIVGSLLQWLRPWWLRLPAWSWAPGSAIAIAGFALAVWARRAQARAGTNVNPSLPTTAIVTDGPYAFTRNPMYLGMLMVHVGLAVALRSLWLVCGLPVTWVLLHFGVIVREERYLDAKFGDVYRAYRARVRRFL
jgi:protein-S-isoprenylcysteine O-methyltransferase Ste14